MEHGVHRAPKSGARSNSLLFFSKAKAAPGKLNLSPLDRSRRGYGLVFLRFSCFTIAAYLAFGHFNLPGM
jgi:hypothetical protein